MRAGRELEPARKREHRGSGMKRRRGEKLLGALDLWKRILLEQKPRAPKCYGKRGSLINRKRKQ